MELVETIQKEQDVAIRDKGNDLLIVQGVAGSGKTSIAMHRIAYLLYSNREKIKNENALIISPNLLFSQYISQLLPELDEENVAIRGDGGGGQRGEVTCRIDVVVGQLLE